MIDLLGRQGASFVRVVAQAVFRFAQDVLIQGSSETVRVVQLLEDSAKHAQPFILVRGSTRQVLQARLDPAQAEVDLDHPMDDLREPSLRVWGSVSHKLR
jgi:hypothetical protein